MSDRDQRSEKPTQQKLRKSREQGKFPISRDFVSAIQWSVFVLLLLSFADQWWTAALSMYRMCLTQGFATTPDGGLSLAALRLAIGPALVRLVGAGMLMTASGLLIQLTTTGFGFAPSKLAPDISRINPMGHLKELPRRNARALLEALILLAAFLGGCWILVQSVWADLLRLPLLPLQAGIQFAGGALITLIWRCTAVLLVWGAIDLFRQRRRFVRDLRMTRTEVKDEYKQTEGNPEVRMKIRMMRRELLRRRMMAEVEKATAVVTNPTHYAVALRYEMQGSAAPKVVAKGRNFLAQRIRERALKHQVPVIENPPLARALYKNVQVGQEIPAVLYRAVAEVLAYVFRIMQGRNRDS